MKASVIREMSLTEIKERIENEKSAYHKMKMNHVVSNLENPIKLKFARKAIARLSTELTKRENEEAGTGTATEVKAKKATPKIEKKIVAEEAAAKETVEADVVEESDENQPEEQAGEKA